MDQVTTALLNEVISAERNNAVELYKAVQDTRDLPLGERQATIDERTAATFSACVTARINLRHRIENLAF